jgi:dTDP-4-amino-4,6-dideoxygalactose transaminase
MAMPAARSDRDAGAGPEGATVAFDRIPLIRPSVPDPERVGARIAGILAGGVLTNGPTVREFERRAAEYLGVRHAIAVSSCTAGLMLVFRAAELSGDVIVPSFTFAATAHAVAWNGLRPVFADVDPETLTLSPHAAMRAITVRTSAILATHIYGTPCDTEALEEAARSHGLRLFYDAAHAFGSRRRGVPIGGFGDAEVFSLSPTKVLVAGEGGVIATNDDVLAERCRIGRDYANPGDYDCRFVGLNARMSELHAATALDSFEGLDERIDRRNEIAARYRDELGRIPGIGFAVVRDADRSTYKDFTVLVDPVEFGATAADLAAELAAAGVETRRYYSPPVHEMQAYRQLTNHASDLLITEVAAARVLSLPMWSEMSDEHVDAVVDAVARVHASAVGGTRPGA